MADPADSSVGAGGPFLADHSTVLDFQKAVLPHVLNAIKKASGLPDAGDSYDYYSSFSAFRELMHLESRRLLQLIQGVLKHQNLRAGVFGNSEDIFEIEEKFDALIEANDQLLERVGTFADEAAGLRKKDADIVVAELDFSSSNTSTPVNIGTTTSWNSASSRQRPLSVLEDGRRRISSTFRLLASRCVDRPQLKFKDKVDNGRTPFIPRLLNKPNALKPWQDPFRNQEDLGDIDPASIRHPYEYELEQLVYSEKQLTKCSASPQMPLSLESSSSVQFIDTESQLMQLLQLLKNEMELAVDLEHHSYRTYQGITCLMQLSTRKQDFIIDALELRSQLHVLNEVFTDPNVVKVFHGADSDINWLQRDLGLYVVNMFDTHQAARALSLVRHSLGHLLQHYCGVHADKQYQLADWRIRPLPEELLRYAREDTHYLLYIYDRMRDELIDRSMEAATGSGLLRTVLEHSRRLCSRVYIKQVFKDDSYLEFYTKSRKTFNSQQLLALARLYGWRDETARAEDESTGYILPNHMLLQIAETLPREREGILACCSTVPPLVKMHLSSLHRMLTEARQVPLQKAEAVRVEAATKKAAQKDSLLHCLHDMTPPVARDSAGRQASSASVVSGLVKLKLEASMSMCEATVKAGATKKPALRDRLHAICQSFVRVFEKYQPMKVIDFTMQSMVKKKASEAEASPLSHAHKRKSSELCDSAGGDVTTPNDSLVTPAEETAGDDTGPPPAKKGVTAASQQDESESAATEPLRKQGRAKGSGAKQKQGQGKGGHFLKPPEEGFQAYDYSKTDLTIFSEKPKKAKHQSEAEIESTVRPSTSRVRTQLGRCGKSVSFKQQSKKTAKGSTRSGGSNKH